MKSRNRYEQYKIDYLDDMDLGIGEEEERETLTEDRAETVQILTARLSCGLWVYGYIVYWADGRTSVSAPNPELGLFRSKREALLYAVGFMQLYAEYFTKETRVSLCRAEQRLSQGTLF